VVGGWEGGADRLEKGERTERFPPFRVESNVCKYVYK
jgi:hypothetical protein